MGATEAMTPTRTGVGYRAARQIALAFLHRWLPQGVPLHEDIWARRHRSLLTVLWLHAAGITVYALVQGAGPIHSVLEGSAIAVAGVVGARATLSKSVRMAAVTLGLVTSSAIMVHLSGGLIEAHFHFFVMVAVVTLYQAWLPFLLAIAYVVLHHGVMGAVDPSSVFNHAAALRHPWKWAAIHGAYIAGASAAGLAAWRLNEQAYRKLASAFESQLVREQHHLQEQARAQQAIRQSAEKFRALVQNSYDIVTVIGPGSTIDYISPSVQRVLGYDPEAMLGGNGADFTHPDDLVMAAGKFTEVIQDPSKTATMTIRARHADGSWRWLEITLHNLLSNPAVNGVVAHQRDITDRKVAEASSKQLEEQLRQSQKMEAVGQLAGGIAHDFNNLLSVIQNFAQFVHDDLEVNDPRREDVTEILGASGRATKLVRQLLTFSRKTMTRSDPCDLNHVVDDIAKLLRRAIPENVELNLELSAGELPIVVDTVEIEQVIMNIAVNARDAMPGGGSLTIRTSTFVAGAADDRLLAPGEYAHLAMTDTGAGMDESTASRVFEPFFSTKARDSGTGLGLATVYGIVEHSGGHIRVDSAIGRGTTFDIYLPLTSAEIHTPAPRPAPTDYTGVETILVAEDEAGVLAVVERVLTSKGYKVLSARSPAEALALANAGQIDLLLTDLVMPQMSGVELASRLPRIKALYMSGYSDEVTSSHGIPAEQIYIQKPFSPEALLDKIRKALDAEEATPLSVV